MRNSSIDGFVRRRSSHGMSDISNTGGLQPSSENRRLSTASHRITEDHEPVPIQPTAESGLSRSEIDDSLNSLDTTAEPPKRGRRKKQLKDRAKRKKRIKWIVIAVVTVLLGLGLYVGIKAFIASGKVFDGSIFGLIQNQPLKKDTNGRSNILVFGTSEDDYEGGVQHAGALLTDSMMVMSIDQEKHNAFTFSIPRDLWVKYDRACFSEYEGKINAFYQCIAGDKNDSPEGANALRKKVGEVTGLDIQYYTHVNYSVVKDAVDAVGGIEVDIKGYGAVPYGVKPGSILDRNFDWKCNYQCYFVKYEPGVHKMDGEHALALARARGANGGYGLQRSNFDREINQQKIAMALVKKAADAGTLTNLGKVTGLIDAMGDNFRTNFETSEIRTLMDIGSKLAQESKSMTSISLIDAEPAILTTTNSNVQPVLGLYDFSGVQAFLKQQLSSNPVVREGAKIGVYNGSGQAGVARKAADTLETSKMTVTVVADAPAGEYAPYTVYVLNDTMTATKAKLEKLYGVVATTGQPPINATGLDFVVIVGKAPEENQQQR